ncbi:MAG: acyl-CoA dehydrogenase family protein, partial [Ilumatobacteraceae bacterium]
NFELNENQKMITQMVRDFAEKEIRPNMKKWDDEEFFPVDTMKKMGELGLLGIYIPEEYGGRTDIENGERRFQELSDGRMPREADRLGIGLNMALPIILQYGTEEQKKRFIASTQACAPQQFLMVTSGW